MSATAIVLLIYTNTYNIYIEQTQTLCESDFF